MRRPRRPSQPALAGRTGLTGRAAVLALVVGVLVAMLAYPLRQYVEHRARVAELERQNAALSRSVEGLARQVERADDPAYVRAEARRRLHFVMRGDKDYVILPAPSGNEGDGTVRVGRSPSDDEPWYGRLWSSVQAASGVQDDGSGRGGGSSGQGSSGGTR